MDLTQPTTYGNSGPYLPKNHETSYDRNLLLIQQQQEEIDRCVKDSPGGTSVTDPDSYLAACQAAQGGAETAETNAETAETGAAASLASMQAAGFYLSEYASLSAAITAIGATEAELIIDKDDTMTGAITVPVNVSLRFVKGNVISVDSFVLTLNCPILAGAYQTFDVSGGGSVAGSPKISYALPEWFGASGDGTTDDYTSINNTASFFPQIMLGVSTYIMSNYLNITTGNLTVVGSGEGSVLKMQDAANLNFIINCEGGDSAYIKGVKFDGNRANQINPSFGSLLRCTDCDRIYVRDCYFVNSYVDGVDILNTSTGEVSGCHIENCKLTGSKYSGVDNARCCNNTYAGSQTEIQVLDASENTIISGNSMIGDGVESTTGIIVVVNDGTKFVNISNNTIDSYGISSGNGITLDGDTPELCRIIVLGNIIKDCRDGISTSDIKRCHIIGNIVENSDIRGILMSGCHDMVVSSNGIYDHDNHISASSSITIGSSGVGPCDGVVIADNILVTATSANSPVGINVSSSQLNIDVHDNIIRGFTTSMTASKVSTIHHNTGFISENGGSTSILSGTTSIAVTHGLSETPNARDITFVGVNNPTNTPGHLWVTAIGSTQFTINCENDPGASNLNLRWKVQLS
jgi:hypothetical protein